MTDCPVHLKKRANGMMQNAQKREATFPVIPLRPLCHQKALECGWLCTGVLSAFLHQCTISHSVCTLHLPPCIQDIPEQDSRLLSVSHSPSSLSSSPYKKGFFQIKNWLAGQQEQKNTERNELSFSALNLHH